MFAFLKDKKFFCPVCNSKVSHFERLPDTLIAKMQDHMYKHSIFAAETLNINNYTCPNCSCSDRDRLYALFYLRMKDEGKISKIKNFVDFAPSVPLSKFLKNLSFPNYRTADLFMKNVDDKVDLTNMKIYADNSIDSFICSHILEHINDDKKAMDELYRILSPEGFAIIMVPINLVNDSIYEGIPANTDDERWHHYGQFDHVRLYNKSGFLERLKSSKFKIKQLGIDYFGESTFNKCGIHKRSILYVVEK